MVRRGLLLLLCLVPTLVAQQTPKLTLSAIHVTDGDSIEVRGSGFTPNRSVLSHLRKPDHSEYPVLQLRANDRGEFLHPIDTLLLLPGTHDLWVVDQSSGVASDTVRFTVGFGDASPALPEVQQTLARHAGVWRSSAVLIALTGKAGTIAGTVAYPARSCGGVLGFYRVYSDSIELSETITYGADRCLNNGMATIKIVEDGSMTFHWRHPTATETKSDKLTTMK